VIFLSAWGGWRRGFIYAAIGLILWVGSLAAAVIALPAQWVEERLSPLFERPVERTIARLSIEGGVHGLMISQEFKN
jgi:uncharacterized membrane protein required for colicin V production